MRMVDKVAKSVSVCKSCTFTVWHSCFTQLQRRRLDDAFDDPAAVWAYTIDYSSTYSSSS